MPEIPTESAPGTWSVPQCPFTIAYLPEVMDNMRLAVMDAFFSLPRGGAEIGGILLGRHSRERVTIADYVPLDCEHATGPSFVLSLTDERNFEKLLDAARTRGDGLQPVGWYHSHTRSDIFLSDIDLELHQRFFPEPWQVALVLKPHTFQPMRGGFFFREPDGSMRITATYQEFPLEALPMRPVPSGVVPSAQSAAAAPQREKEAAAQVIPFPEATPEETREPVQVAEVPVPQFVPLMLEPPRFATVAPEARSWLWLKVVAFLSIGLGAGAVGYQTRQTWLPKLLPSPGSASPVSLGLTALDTEGQLQIRWDRSAPALQQAASGTLTVTDGGKPGKVIPLDQDHLRSGIFTYAREGEQVDVLLVVDQPSGPPLRSVTAFVGRLPVKSSSAPDDQTPKLRQDLAAREERVRTVEAQLSEQTSEANRLKKDLAAQVDRARKLEKNLSDANERNKRLDDELKQQQRKRMGAQDPGKQE